MSTADALRGAIADDQGSVDGMCAHELTNRARVRERTTPRWFPRTALISSTFRTHPPLMHNFVDAIIPLFAAQRPIVSKLLRDRGLDEVCSYSSRSLARPTRTLALPK
jgi:hypothetical protein